MTTLTRQQNSALDIIDFIHFFDIYYMVSACEEQEKYFEEILDLINDEIRNKGIDEKFAQIFKHYLICGIEIYFNKINNLDEIHLTKVNLAKETVDAVQEYNVHFSIALLSLIAERKGIDRDQLIDSVEKISFILEKNNYPLSLNYRLANQLFCYEYKGAALFLYKKFLDLEILTSKKYQKEKSDSNLSKTMGLDNIFIRAGLIIEFEMYRMSSNTKTSIEKKISLEIPDEFASESHKKNLIRYYKKLIDHSFNVKPGISLIMFDPILCLNSKDNTNKFLLEIYDEFIHNRMFIQNHSGWISTLGAYYIQLYKEINEKKPIYCASNNENTSSHFSSTALSKLGFTISSRNLYLQYKKLRCNQYEQIRQYHLQILKLPTLLNWDSIDHFYHFSLKFIPKNYF